MHGHQLQVVLRRHYVTWGPSLREQVQPRDRETSPTQMDAHEPGKEHSEESRDQGQRVILLADDLMISTEDVLPNEAGRGSMTHCMCGHVVHCAHLKPDVWATSCANSALLQSCLLLNPGVVIFLRLHLEIGLHVVMPEAAKLGADDFVLSDFCCREMNREIQARDEILLDTQFGDVEGMAHVLRMHEQVDLAIDGDGHLSGNDVVFGSLVVRGIEPEEICVSLADLVGVNWAEDSVRTGIAEIKGELTGLDLDRQRISSRRGEIDAGPRLYAEHTQSQTFGAYQQESGDN